MGFIDLRRFAKDNGVVLGENVIDACNFAAEEMDKSRDPLHNFEHVEAMMNDLQQFMNEDKTMKWNKVDMEAVILAIYWHDVWKSKKFSKSIKTMLAHNMYEGIGSMRIFGRYAKKFKIGKLTSKRVSYAIRKHSLLQFLPKRSVESKILFDLDNLQQWSVKRIVDMIKAFGNLRNLNPIFFKMADLYFRRRMLKINENKYYFKWSQGQLTARRKVFLKEIKEILVKHAGDIWQKYKGSRMVAESV
jgi:hypothetical protein